MRAPLLIAAVELRFVAMRPNHAGLQIVRHDDLRDRAKVLKRPNVRADPVRQPLRPGRLRIGVVRRAHHRDEHLGRANLPGRPVDHRGGLTGVIDEQLLSSAVILTHHHVQPAPPAPVTQTKRAVLVTAWMRRLVLVPQQLQRHPLAFELPMHRSPIGRRTRRPRRGRRRKQPPLQLRIVQPRRDTPQRLLRPKISGYFPLERVATFK